MSSGWQKIARLLMKPLIPFAATHMLACSSSAGKAIFSGTFFSVLPNAISAKDFRYNKDIREQVRTALKLDDSYGIIHIGRFTEEKNHSFLIDCFAQLQQSTPDAKLILIGDGPLCHDIKEKVCAQFSEDSVLFLGVRRDIPELLQAADCFLLPSVFEGLPVTLIEAQAAGLPCIKSSTITDECIVTDLVTSLPIDDPALWAREILKNRNTPRQNQHAAIVKSGYDITTASKKLQNFYLNGDPL
jgi:glycosyltransferase involved in cell wall biosynthesis